LNASHTIGIAYFTFPRVGYYDGATELYEYGWAQSFHFSRFYKGEAFAASLARHEHYLAAQMSLRPGMRVLDVGCGVGGPAREIARFSDAKIVGLNNNEFQIGRARRYTKAAGLEDQIQFVKGDFMKLAEQFGENAFDAGASSFCISCYLSSLIYGTLVTIQFMPLRLRFMPRHGKAFTAKY
jgi:SAM-dependent methyltransferase